MKIEFRDCPNGNKCGTVKFNTKEGVDVIKLVTTTGKYKIKPFEMVRDKKTYVKDLLDGHGEFPIVDKEQVREVIEEIKELCTD